MNNSTNPRAVGNQSDSESINIADLEKLENIAAQIMEQQTKDETLFYLANSIYSNFEVWIAQVSGQSIGNLKTYSFAYSVHSLADALERLSADIEVNGIPDIKAFCRSVMDDSGCDFEVLA